MYPGKLNNPNLSKLNSKLVVEVFHGDIDEQYGISVINNTQRIIDDNVPTKEISSYEDIPLLKNIIRENKFNRILKIKSKQTNNYYILINVTLIDKLYEDNYFNNIINKNNNKYLYKFGKYIKNDVYINTFLNTQEYIIYIIKDDFYFVDKFEIELINNSSFLPKKRFQYNFYYKENLSNFVEKYKIINHG